ncbi:MAG: hypothetical protein M0R38_05315 [Bacteroidia bacterium]|nr:hypothetical protein [Bacteroidia bacterium]
MKNLFSVGNTKFWSKTVTENDIASFTDDKVHPVYSTFALGRDAEWACRQFVLEMKEAHEEGIGTFLTIQHLSPALVGQKVEFEVTICELKGNAIHCNFTARVGNRVIATGTQGQKILTKEKINSIFQSLQ